MMSSSQILMIADGTLTIARSILAVGQVKTWASVLSKAYPDSHPTRKNVMMSYGGKASHPTFRDDFALLDFVDYMSITSLDADKMSPRASWLAMTFIAGVAMLA